MARFERTLADGGTVWEAARAGCVHCAEAPCAEVCPTGALAVSGETGFVSLDAARCVGCHLCAMVCPADAPRHRGERGELCLCDGCGAEVAEGSVPACVAACPLDALAFDDRDAVVSRANERAAVLRERGWANASVLGVSEQGGHHVVQVMKYGVGGSMHEALASTGEVGCIGENFHEAILKSMMSVGYAIPKKNILLSTGDSRSKMDMLSAAKALQEKGYNIFATKGTAQFLETNGVHATVLHWPDQSEQPNTLTYIKEKKIDLVVNIPKNLSKTELSNDYTIRRSAIDFNIPLITNARLASAFITAFCKLDKQDIKIKSWNEY